MAVSRQRFGPKMSRTFIFLAALIALTLGAVLGFAA
ncbi:hypothetical protein FHS83_002166 [Rhizomicrobium palustre]|uniref:Uncharacterized protein n=1 Tax=Rhizomicrobium palustre TaxID=189966 RepID=A0A846MYY6_9PROT|nr:hypothetical protein [Rhizomicrobium palustre]